MEMNLGNRTGVRAIDAKHAAIWQMKVCAPVLHPLCQHECRREIAWQILLTVERRYWRHVPLVPL
jgi:hypothetical protein